MGAWGYFVPMHTLSARRAISLCNKMGQAPWFLTHFQQWVRNQGA